MLHLDAGGFVFRAEGGFWQGFEELGQAREKTQPGTEFGEAGVCHIVHPEVVEQALHVGEFAIPFLFVDEFVALGPELRGINPELGEHHVVLHVAGAERLVIIVNQRDGILSGCHEREGRDTIAGNCDKAEIGGWVNSLKHFQCRYSAREKRCGKAPRIFRLVRAAWRGCLAR